MKSEGRHLEVSRATRVSYMCRRLFLVMSTRMSEWDAVLLWIIRWCQVIFGEIFVRSDFSYRAISVYECDRPLALYNQSQKFGSKVRRGTPARKTAYKIGARFFSSAFPLSLSPSHTRMHTQLSLFLFPLSLSLSLSLALIFAVFLSHSPRSTNGYLRVAHNLARRLIIRLTLIKFKLYI